MKKTKSDALPEYGHLKKEAIDKLRREGYDVSFEQLRKYETPGLARPDKKPGSNYRIYTPETLERIRQICRLRIIGFSLPRIKLYFDLKDKITGNDLFITRKAGEDPDTGEPIIIKELPPADAVNEVKYERLRAQVEEYNSMCNEIKEKAGKIARIMANTKEETDKVQKEIEKITALRD